MNKELIRDIKQILITTSFIVLSIIVSNAELKTAFLLLAYMIVSIQIFIKAYKSLKNGGFLDENFLMAIASIGAFLIGEQIEANVAKIDGVNSVSVNFFTTTMKIDFDENKSEEIIENIRKIIKKLEPDTVLEV